MDNETKKQIKKSFTVAETFAKLGEKNESALVTYMLSGYPTGNTALDIDVVNALVNGDADIIELGVPTKTADDAYLDGPTIKAAITAAQTAHLRTHHTEIILDSVFNSALKIRETENIPIILMGYNDAIFKYNYEPNAFFSDEVNTLFSKMQECDIQDLLIPDLSDDNRKIIFEISKSYGIDLAGISNPQTPEKSLEDVLNTESGFHYLALDSQTGGNLKNLNPDEMNNIIARIRKYSNIPIVAGFGIKTPEDAAQVCNYADGCVIGSEIIRQINCDTTHDFKGVSNYVRELKNATKNKTRAYKI